MQSVIAAFERIKVHQVSIPTLPGKPYQPLQSYELIRVWCSSILFQGIEVERQSSWEDSGRWLLFWYVLMAWYGSFIIESSMIQPYPTTISQTDPDLDEAQWFCGLFQGGTAPAASMPRAACGTAAAWAPRCLKMGYIMAYPCISQTWMAILCRFNRDNDDKLINHDKPLRYPSIRMYQVNPCGSDNHIWSLFVELEVLWIFLRQSRSKLLNWGILGHWTPAAEATHAYLSEISCSAALAKAATFWSQAHLWTFMNWWVITSNDYYEEELPLPVSSIYW